MRYREATVADIPQLQTVRHSVTENILSDNNLVTEEHYQTYLTQHGKGWVCEINNEIVGFAIASLNNNNVWALFVKPGFDKRGIGKFLHTLMLEWYFSQTIITIWLSTAPQTRAEMFYRMNGWRETGMQGKDETRFEMTLIDWRAYKKKLEAKHF